MFGADVLVAQAHRFLVSQVNHPFYAGRDEKLVGAALAVNGGCARRTAQDFVYTGAHHADIHPHAFQKLGDDAILLFQKRQQQVFRIHLVMAIPLKDFISAGSSVLGALCKTIKPQHSASTFVYRRIASIVAHGSKFARRSAHVSQAGADTPNTSSTFNNTRTA